jgi:hypothetical protein
MRTFRQFAEEQAAIQQGAANPVKFQGTYDAASGLLSIDVPGGGRLQVTLSPEQRQQMDGALASQQRATTSQVTLPKGWETAPGVTPGNTPGGTPAGFPRMRMSQMQEPY